MVRFFLVCAIVCLTGCSSAQTGKKSAKARVIQGTLHKSSGEQWLAATPENQIATAADFAANFYSGTTRADAAVLRDETVLLAACITKTFTLPSDAWKDADRHRTVEEIASACWSMLSFPRNN